ncbi:MAG: hypothetical protein ABIA93_04565 [Candidatus Woesearchaeota archaeon]
MRAQAWSMDLVIAVLIFTAIIAVFFAFVGKGKDNDAKGLENDARMIAAKLDADNADSIPLVSQGKIDAKVLAQVYNMSYEELKVKLGTSRDFCIYLETADGRILPVQLDVGEKTSMGDPNLTINGDPCGAGP